MNTLKDQLNQYMHTQESQVVIDAALKQILHGKLTTSSQRKWWKLIVPIVAVGAVGGVAFLIIPKQDENRPSISDIVMNSLLPQEALAAALEKTFTLDTFATTFGLQHDGQLHHLTLKHTLLEPAHQNNDRSIAATTNVSMMDIWSLDSDIKIAESKQDVTLLNSTEGKICIGNDCQTLEEVQEKALDSNLSDNGWFYPVTSETMIDDVSLEKFFDNLNGPGAYVGWSTTTPLHQAQFVSATDSFIGGSGAAILGYDSHGMKWFTNEERDGKYWHRMPLYHSLEDNTNIYYIQILEIDNTDYFGTPNPEKPATLRRGSMIYQLDYSAQTIVPVTPEAVAQAIRDQSIAKVMLSSNYNRAIQPALYVLRHINDFNEPVSVEVSLENGQETKKMQYSLPDSYMAELKTTYSGPHDESAKYIMNIYLDTTETQFLGYEVKQNETTLESLWLTDAVLPSEQANEIFKIKKQQKKSN